MNQEIHNLKVENKMKMELSIKLVFFCPSNIGIQTSNLNDLRSNNADTYVRGAPRDGQ